jgi:hypothetical protein
VVPKSSQQRSLFPRVHHVHGPATKDSGSFILDQTILRDIIRLIETTYATFGTRMLRKKQDPIHYPASGPNVQRKIAQALHLVHCDQPYLSHVLLGWSERNVARKRRVDKARSVLHRFLVELRHAFRRQGVHGDVPRAPLSIVTMCWAISAIVLGLFSLSPR